MKRAKKLRKKVGLKTHGSGLQGLKLRLRQHDGRSLPTKDTSGKGR